MRDDIVNMAGWGSTKELEFLQSTASQLPPKSLVVEIGSWKGRSTAALFSMFDRSSTLVTIDTWFGSVEDRSIFYSDVYTADIFKVFMENMETLFGFFPRPFMVDRTGFLFLRAHAEEAFLLFKDQSIDFWYNDGDHLQLNRDLELWQPKIKPGGIMAGHDYCDSYPSVKEVVNARFKFYELVDTIWYTRNIKEE